MMSVDVPAGSSRRSMSIEKPSSHGRRSMTVDAPFNPVRRSMNIEMPSSKRVSRSSLTLKRANEQWYYIFLTDRSGPSGRPCLSFSHNFLSNF